MQTELNIFFQLITLPLSSLDFLPLISAPLPLHESRLLHFPHSVLFFASFVETMKLWAPASSRFINAGHSSHGWVTTRV